MTKKILVMGPAWVGDMVLAHSLFQLLKQQNPNVQIDVAAPAWTLALLDRMPEVTDKIILPFKHGQLAFIKRIKLGRSLQARQYTQSISLVNSLKSALIPFAANIPKRTGFLGELRYGLLNDIRPLDKTVLTKTVQRFVALGCQKGDVLPEAPQPKLIADEKNSKALCKQLNIALSKQKILGLCPGAEYGEAKRWPISHYTEVANSVINKGWQVLLFGSSKDQPITSKINELTQSRCINLGGQTSLNDVIDIMSLCHTIISNDSGLMHVAAALDKKLIAIFGSSDPNHTPPMHPKAVIAYLALDCSPCFKRTCPLDNPAQHLQCLTNITPTTIMNQLKI